jgi:flagellar biogenesis protein FliO
MMPEPAEPPRPAPFRPSPLLIGIGVFVIAVGFGLPYLTSGATTAQTKTEPAPESPKASSPPTGGEGPGLGTALARLIGCLVVVCGSCVIVARWVGRKAPAATGAMTVLAALPVDARCAVYLVRAGERRLLIGTDPAGVKALVELPGAVVEPPPEAPTEPAAVETPAEVLGPVPVPPAAVPNAPPGRDEILALLARLRAGTEAGAPAG